MGILKAIGWDARRCSVTLPGRKMARHDLRYMQGRAPSGLLDLLPAAKTVRQNEHIRCCLADLRQKDPFRRRHGHSIFRGLEAKGSRHSAAARAHHFVIKPKFLQDSFLGRGVEDCMMMAVELDERALAAAHRTEFRSLAVEKLGEEFSVFGKPVGPLLAREQILQLVTEGADACRLKADNGHPLLDGWAENVEVAPPQRLGLIEPAPIVKRAAAADGSRRNRNFIVETLQNLGCRNGRINTEIIVESVRPKHHPAALEFGLPLAEPLDKGLPGIRRYLAVLGDASGPFRGCRDPWRAGEKICKPGCRARKARPAVDEPHRISSPRPQFPRIMVSAEFGLISRHIDMDRAIAFAPFASEAKIERVFDLPAAPAICDHATMQHLEEEPRAPACGILLLARCHIARAHHALLASFPAAKADADAAPRRFRKAAVVFFIGEVVLDFRRLIGGADAQIGRDREGIDDFAGVHAARRIPDRLELAEGLDKLGAIHLLEERTARLAVAMLAGKRAAVADDEIRALVEKALPIGEASLRAQIERNPAMDEAIAEVAIDRSLIAVSMKECLEVAQIIAEHLAGHGGIFPAVPSLWHARNMGRCAERRFAQLPNFVLLALVRNDFRRMALRAHGLCGFIGFACCIGFVFTSEFRDEPAIAIRQHRDVFGMNVLAPHELDQEIINPFKRNRAKLQNFGNGIRGLEDVFET